MNLSIVIPAFNEEKLLGATLRSVQRAAGAFTARGFTWELLVCDNNSTDRTAAIAHEAGAQVVFEPVNQIARARNTGARAAQGDWLLFIDADSQPSRELFADVAELLQDRSVLAAGVTVRFDWAAWRIRFWCGLWNGISRCLRWMAGSFILCETAAFRQLGGFDERLFVAEELDLSRRLKQLARAQRRRIVILHRHPLVTSARKARLYSQREMGTFLWRSVWSRGRVFHRRDACAPWYDGRR